MCFLVFFFFLIGLPLSFVSSKILVYITKLRIKGLIIWNTILKTTSTTFHMLNSKQIEISRPFVSWKHNLNNLNIELLFVELENSTKEHKSRTVYLLGIVQRNAKRYSNCERLLLS